MNGLFLQGGGAKGAFQAGAIHALQDRGVDFHIITGTSIGAMNAYCLYLDRLEQLEEFWKNSQSEIDAKTKYFGKVFENKRVIDQLGALKGKNDKVHSLYVNYVEIECSIPREVVVDLTTLDREAQLETVKFSSLLPLRMEKEMTMLEIIHTFDSHRIFSEFQEDLIRGEYDGYCLDGGILNNNLLAPFLDNKVDRLFLIPFEKEYQIPEYITEAYRADELVVITPETELVQSDMMRFEKEFCTKLYAEGYEIGRKLSLD